MRGNAAATHEAAFRPFRIRRACLNCTDRTTPFPSQITPPERYYSRRELLGGLAAAGAIGVGLPQIGLAAPLKATKNPRLSLKEPPNSVVDITTYNNFYEFVTDQADPARRSGKFKTQPWSVTVAGKCAKPGTYTLEDVLKPHALEERVYRLRCVEAWSMVVPWVGFPLGDLLRRFEPNSKAKYVAFRTVLRPDRPSALESGTGAAHRRQPCPHRATRRLRR